MSTAPLRIALCLKGTPAPTEVADLALSHQLRVDPSGQSLRLGHVPTGVHGFDEQALGTVVELRRAGLDCHVTVVTVDSDDSVPQRAFELGIDAALSITGGSGLTALGMARVLAAAARRAEATVAVVGDASADLGGGSLGGLLAAVLDWPYVFGVHDVRLTPDEVVARRQRPSGALEEVAAGLPVVVGVRDDGWEPVQPRARDVLAARDRQPERIDAADLLGGTGPPLGGSVERVALEIDDLAHSCRFLTGPPQAVAVELIAAVTGMTT
jgi:electron transfer flavoprotein beta subunit